MMEPDAITDVVELCSLLQCVGFTVKSLDTSETNRSQDGDAAPKTVVINCQSSGIHVVLESPAQSCSCPVAEQQSSGFWQVSGVSGGKQMDKESGSTLLRALPKEYRERLSKQMFDIIRCIRALNDIDAASKPINKSTSLLELGSKSASIVDLANKSTSLVELSKEGNKSASIVEMATPEKKHLQCKIETPTRYRSLDTLTKDGQPLLNPPIGGKPELNRLPATEEGWLAISNRFLNTWNFPHAIGAMDGKHVVLQSPINSGNDYDNYKSFPSIVLFALVDDHYKFLYVNVGSKGRISDGGVFKNTKLYQKLEKRELYVPSPTILQIPYSTEVPFYILGDKAFQLNEYTMKPYEGNPERGSKERIFNYRLSRSRRVVENAFGVLSSVYRVLRKPMLLEPETATKVVLASIHLYNYLRRSSSNGFVAPGHFDVVRSNGEIVAGSWRNEPEPTSLLPIEPIPRRGTMNAKEIRDHLARHFITNGTITWQDDYQ